MNKIHEFHFYIYIYLSFYEIETIIIKKWYIFWIILIIYFNKLFIFNNQNQKSQMKSDHFYYKLKI